MPSAHNRRGPLACSHCFLVPPAYREAQATMFPGGAGFSEADLRQARPSLPSLLLYFPAHCCHGDRTPSERCGLLGVQLPNTLVESSPLAPLAPQSVKMSKLDFWSQTAQGLRPQDGLKALAQILVQGGSLQFHRGPCTCSVFSRRADLISNPVSHAAMAAPRQMRWREG